jgi:hydrogenase maturation protease
VTTPEALRCPTLVVGFGNTLAGDDGVGPLVARRLAALDLPSGARVVEARTDALELAGLWHGEPRVWMVDALIRGSAPGTIHRLDHDDVFSVPQRHATVHHLSLPECLRWLAVAEPAMNAVRYRLYGVEPERVGLREGLSPAVAAAAERLVERLLEELAYLPG